MGQTSVLRAAHFVEGKPYQQRRAAGQWLSRRQATSARELYGRFEMSFSCNAYENFLLVAGTGFAHLLMTRIDSVRTRTSTWGS
jgi:hypothetical protein